MQMETFSYRLADDMWHKVALSVSGSEIELLIDCRPLTRRQAHSAPDRKFSASKMQLFLGQSNKDGQSMLKVSSVLPGTFSLMFEKEV